MAYDEGLAERIRGVLQDRQDVAEKKMFGGLAFMIRGHMAVGILKDDLLVRVGADRHDELVQRPHARVMDFTGRPMKGFILVAATGVEEDRGLEEWIGRGLRYAVDLPAKDPGATTKGRRSVRRL